MFADIEDGADAADGDLSRVPVQRARVQTSGLRFYQELKRTGKRRVPTGNCLAVIVGQACPDGSLEGIGALFDSANSAVCGTAFSRDYLRGNCRRCSAEFALKSHPALAEYLRREGGAK